jgi:DNA-binding response OmpR family regulator
MKVLIADDDRDIARAVQIRLEQAGFDVVQAHDGDSALATAQTALPDLIILDISMPGRDGFDVFEALRESPETANVPVLFLTAHGSVPNWLSALKGGAADFICKPYDGVRLIRTVRETLARSEAA